MRTIGRNFLPVRRQPRRQPAERLHRSGDRQLAQHRRGDRPAERVDALHAAGEPVRHVGVGSGAAGDVGDRRAPIRRRSKRSACGSTPACAASRSSSSRRPSPFSRSATWLSARCFRPAGSTTATRSTSGGFSPARRSDCWRRRSARLYSSTYYAFRDTRTPLRYAVIRVALTTVLGYLLRDSAAGAARARAGVGRGGADRVGRHRRLGRDAAAARDAERADRPHRPAGVATSRSSGDPRLPAPRIAWGVKIALAAAASDRDGGPRARTVRRRLSRDDARAAHPGSVDSTGARRETLAGATKKKPPRPRIAPREVSLRSLRSSRFLPIVPPTSRERS